MPLSGLNSSDPMYYNENSGKLCRNIIASEFRRSIQQKMKKRDANSISTTKYNPNPQNKKTIENMDMKIISEPRGG